MDHPPPESKTPEAPPAAEQFEGFVRASQTALVRTAYLLVGDRGHAEDLVQTALTRTLSRWPVAKAAPAAYTRAVLVNLAKDRARSRSRRVAEASLDGMPARLGAVGAQDEQVVLRQTLLEATRRLPPRQRAVLVLRFFDDLSVEQVAETMHCSVGTVKSQTHDALARLRPLLGSPTATPRTETTHRETTHRGSVPTDNAQEADHVPS